VPGPSAGVFFEISQKLRRTAANNSSANIQTGKLKCSLHPDGPGIYVETCRRVVMPKQEAEQIISSLELIVKSLEYPMYLGFLSDDKVIRKIIGEFSSKLISEIHFELIPKIKEHYGIMPDNST
jgi:hypothetical protein